MLIMLILLKLIILGWAILMSWLVVINYSVQCLNTRVTIDILDILEKSDKIKLDCKHAEAVERVRKGKK